MAGEEVICIISRVSALAVMLSLLFFFLYGYVIFIANLVILFCLFILITSFLGVITYISSLSLLFNVISVYFSSFLYLCQVFMVSKYK